MTVSPALLLTPEDVLRRVQWHVLRRLDGRLQGDYRTLYKGRGLDVADLREYQFGDDARDIDWNVTARTDVVHVKEYLADRETTAWLLLDVSASMAFGAQARPKLQVMAELTGAFLQVLTRGGNRVGAVMFDSAVRETIPPGSGRDQVLLVLSQLLKLAQKSGQGIDTASGSSPTKSKKLAGRLGRGRSRAASSSADSSQPGSSQTGSSWAGSAPSNVPNSAANPLQATTFTDLDGALRALGGIAVRRSLVVVISDLLTPPTWRQALGMLSQRHDVLLIQITDPRESELPAVGLVWVQDAETGEQILVDTDDASFRSRLAHQAAQRQQEITAAARQADVEVYQVSSAEDVIGALLRIAQLRTRRRG